jgi:hypothetical protein
MNSFHYMNLSSPFNRFSRYRGQAEMVRFFIACFLRGYFSRKRVGYKEAKDSPVCHNSITKFV